MTRRPWIAFIWLGLALEIAAGPRAALAELELLAADFPVYLFTRNLLAGVPDSRVTLLADAQVCPHDHVLTPAELERLSRADILVSGGLALDAFLERGLALVKPGLTIIDASGGGFSVRAGQNQNLLLDRDTARKWYRAPRPEKMPDPHLFASLSGAMTMTENLAEALARLDPGRADLYRANANDVNARLQRLLYDFQAIAARWYPRPRVILSHRALSRLATDLALNVADIIEGAEQGPVSDDRLAELVSRAQGCAAVLAYPHGQLDPARTVGAKARRPVAVIDPAASGPADPPEDYFQKVFMTNLAVLNELFTSQNETEPNTKSKDEN